MALLGISDPDHAPRPRQEALRQLFGLTPAESRLAAALAARRSLHEYATEAGISLGTARWTLRRILEKTQMRRQRELVLATSVANLFT